MTTESDRSTLVSPAETGQVARIPTTVEVSATHQRTPELGQLSAGEILGGRFRIVELIQSGGMGDVYRAEDLSEKVDVAVKTLRSGASTMARFEREAARLSELDHPGIPRYVAHDLSSPQGPYLVMEWFPGVSLADHLRKQSFGLRSAIDLFRKIVDAVQHAHERGIVHRDLNPNNILVSFDPSFSVKVLDFGIAKLEQDERPLTAEGTQIGTPGYMAPEQVEGRADIGPAVDVFALGCIFYEVLAGQRAFYAPTIRELLTRIVTDTPPPPSDMRRGIPQELDELVLSLLEKEAPRRPDSAGSLALILASLPEYDDSSLSDEEPSLPASSIQQVASVIVFRDTEQSTYERAVRAADQHGLSVRRSPDGTIVVATNGRGTASDHAARAARGALSIQRATRVNQMAVSTGLSQTTGKSLSGRAFDSALVSLLLKDADAEMFSGPCLWLDENTASLLDSRFDVRSVEQGFLLRGLRETYEPARTVLGRRTRCVGRKRELSMLEATLAESFEEGNASVVLVTGPPGAGKTRLAAETVRVARRTVPGVQVFRGNADSISAGAPFSALTTALARGLRIRDSEPQVVRREKLREHMAKILPPEELQRVTEFIGELLEIAQTRQPSAQLEAARRDAVLRGDQILRALQDWMRGECRHHPVVLVLDDFHWGDLPTVKFVDAALRNLTECPLVVLALARPEVHDLFPELWARRGLTELRLSGLSRRAATEMVREVMGHDVRDEVVERVVQRAQGNPFWIEELLRAEDAGQGDNIPDRIVLLAQSRIEQQTLEERRLLQAASVFGREFWLGGAKAVLGPESMSIATESVARALVESEFMVEHEMSRLSGEREYQFASGLLRDAAYSLLDDDDREISHLRAAEWLEKNGQSDPLTIAMHFTLGGEADRARPHYLRAAEQALSGDDLDAAISCAEEGLGAGARGRDAVRLRLVHAEASKWRGDNAAAFRSAQAAFARAEESSPEWYRAAAEAAVAAGKSGKTETSMAIAKELTESPLKESALGERAIALSRVAGQMVLSGKTDIAKELLRAARVLEGRVQPDPQVMGFYSEAQALLAGATDDPSGRIHYAERAAQHFEDAGDLRNSCLARLSQGFAELEFGENAGALLTLNEALRIAESMGLENSVAVAQLQLGRALSRTGKPDEGLALLERAAASLDRQKNVRLSGVARLYQSEVHLILRSPESAFQTTQHAQNILRDLPPLLRLAHAMAALIAARLGDKKLAGESGPAALKSLDAGSRLPVGETTVRLGGAAGLFATGDREAARAILQEERRRVLKLMDGMDPEKAEAFVRGCPARSALFEATLTSGESPENAYARNLEAFSVAREHPAASLALPRAPSGTGLETTQDPVLRCLSLAQSYAQLSDELSGALDRQNLNWATFASRAAKSAGRSLARRELSTYFEAALGGSSGPRLWGLSNLVSRLLRLLGIAAALRETVAQCLDELAARAADSLVEFHGEIAEPIEGFRNLIRDNPSEQRVAAYLGELVNVLSSERDQHRLLKKAFTSWFQASRTDDEALRAQLMLRGNCQLALQQQSRLQRTVQELESVRFPDLIFRALPERLGLFGAPFSILTRLLAPKLFRQMGKLWCETAATYALRLSLPEGDEVQLGGERPSLPASYPTELREISDPKTEAFLERFDEGLQSPSLASVGRWSRVNDRMRVHVQILRGRQKDLAWFASPFSTEQKRALLAGRIPEDVWEPEKNKR